MYFSPVRYGYSAMLTSQFPVENKPETVKIIDSYGFENVEYWWNIFAMLMLFIGFRAAVILSLWCQDSEKSKGMVDTRNTTISKRKGRHQNVLGDQ